MYGRKAFQNHGTDQGPGASPLTPLRDAPNPTPSIHTHGHGAQSLLSCTNTGVRLRLSFAWSVLVHCGVQASPWADNLVRFFVAAAGAGICGTDSWRVLLGVAQLLHWSLLRWNFSLISVVLVV
ncbi:hypothetical protein M758_3G114600 [Ceratodon purpureus]|nr:hypothetical protein M758_3G114600 [Ceratodon purpureus]